MDLRKTVFFIGLYILSSSGALSWAQVKKIKERSLVTGKEVTITIQGEYKDILKTPERKQGTILFRRNADDLLLGNACAEAVMKQYKFRYAVVPRNQNMSGSRFFFHNLWANTKLFFKNGPFWKKRLRKKIKKCREQTGDFVGFNVTYGQKQG